MNWNSDEEDRDTPTLDDFTQDVDKSSMNYVGKETINGVSCHVVESKNLNSDYQVLRMIKSGVMSSRIFSCSIK